MHANIQISFFPLSDKLLKLSNLEQEFGWVTNISSFFKVIYLSYLTNQNKILEYEFISTFYSSI